MKNIKEQKPMPNSIESTIEELNVIRYEISLLKEKEEEIKKQLIEDFRDKLKIAYKEKSEPFGVVNFEEGENKISFTTPKKVKWDQKGLKSIYEDGGPVDLEFSVKEAVYKDIDDEGRKILIQYRMVEPGAISIKVERK